MGILSQQDVEEISEGESGRFDWPLLVTAAVILLIGVAMIFSAVSNEGARSSLALRQFAFAGVGLLVGCTVLIFDYRLYERLAYFVYGINLFMLILVEFIGQLRYGARRWIDLGFISYQPSETMKFATILALARYFQNRASTEKMDFKDLLIPGLMLGIPALFTIAQPDLGTGGHLAMIGVAILLFMGIRSRVFITGILIAIISFPLVWQYGLKEYQRDRVRTFIDPMSDPKGEGYNALQSMIAVGSGQVFGKGFRQGTQTQLHFTPEGHTDFIFTVLAEEWGFVGCLVLLGLYLFLLSRCVAVAASARDKFGAILCVGIIAMLASQIMINMAMVMGMFPVVGIPLPLLSYGGTSIVTVSAALGLLLNVGYRRSIF